jgi:hypothetical protein
MGMFTDLLTRFTSDNYIFEAARFRTRDKLNILRNNSNFRIGLEFEFEVNGGLDFSEVLDQAVSEHPMQVKFRRAITQPIDKLSSVYLTLSDLANGSSQLGELRFAYETLNDVVDDQDEESIDFVTDNIMPLVFDFLDAYVSLYSVSKSLERLTEATPPSGLGVLHETLDDAKVVTLIRTIQSTRNRYDDLHTRDKFVFYANCHHMLKQIERYLLIDCRKIPLSVKTIGDVSTLLTSFYVKQFTVRNPDMGTVSMESKVDIIKRTHPLPKQYVQDIVFDSTVIRGGELITKPLNVDQVRDVLMMMEDYIDKIGGTTSATGLHVNISRRDMTFNAVKAITLLDTEFFQNLSPKSELRPKYNPRFMVESIIPILQPEYVLESLAKSYLTGGSDALITRYEAILNSGLIKGKAVNLEHYLHNADVKSQRVEFRFFGGTNYHKRSAEIFDDILNVLYVASLASDENMERDTYLRSIIRMLDRATDKNQYISDRSFLDLLTRLRKTQKH